MKQSTAPPEMSCFVGMKHGIPAAVPVVEFPKIRGTYGYYNGESNGKENGK